MPCIIFVTSACTAAVCAPSRTLACTVTVRAPSIRVSVPVDGAAVRVTKFEIGTGPFAVGTRNSSSIDSVRSCGGRRRRMSTASSSPAGR